VAGAIVATACGSVRRTAFCFRVLLGSVVASVAREVGPWQVSP
jgi:hypothetical protein